MKTLTETLNDFYGNKPYQWSIREDELIEFEKDLKLLQFKPAAFVIFTRAHYQRLDYDGIDGISAWFYDNDCKQVGILTSIFVTKIMYVYAFEDDTDAALFKLRWC